MQKIINIDGREVKFATNAATPFKYKKEFQSDFFADLVRMAKTIGDDRTDNLDALSWEDVDQLNFDVIYQIIYIMAKTGNPQLDPMERWLESFDEFPLDEILGQCTELIEGLMKRKK